MLYKPRSAVQVLVLLLWDQAWEHENGTAAWVQLKEPDGAHLSPERSVAKHPVY